MVATKGATVLQDVAFVRDLKGRITSVTTVGRPTDSWSYTYDDLDRLTSATNAGNAAWTQTFAYDASHNPGLRRGRRPRTVSSAPMPIRRRGPRACARTPRPRPGLTR